MVFASFGVALVMCNLINLVSGLSPHLFGRHIAFVAVIGTDPLTLVRLDRMAVPIRNGGVHGAALGAFLVGVAGGLALVVLPPGETASLPVLIIIAVLPVGPNGLLGGAALIGAACAMAGGAQAQDCTTRAGAVPPTSVGWGRPIGAVARFAADEGWGSVAILYGNDGWGHDIARLDAEPTGPGPAGRRRRRRVRTGRGGARRRRDGHVSGRDGQPARRRRRRGRRPAVSGGSARPGARRSSTSPWRRSTRS
jgi:hypothetical protein